MSYCWACGCRHYPLADPSGERAAANDTCEACGCPTISPLGERRAQLPCPTCGFDIDRDAAVCSRCGAPLPRTGSEPPAACPSCGPAVGFTSWRMDRELGAPAIYTCRRCAGCWIDRAQWTRLRERVEPAGPLVARDVPRIPLPAGFRLGPAPPPLPCPRCRAPMLRRNFGSISGLLVDACFDHGWWFPPGLLYSVLRFVRRGGLALARRQGLARRDDLR